MSVTDKQILGSNLCNIECTEKNNIIHPETCVNQVLIGNGSTVNLPAWFDGDNDPEVHHGSFGDYSNMLAWLGVNYPHNTYTLPIATNEVLGGIKVGEHLTIDSETGVLSVNLNVPSYSQATYADLGLIKLGDNNPLPSTVGSDITIFPVQLDSVGHAGVAIPNSNLTQVNADWTAESGSPAYIEHKPSISNAQITLQLNSASIGSFTLNQSTPSTINISLGQPLNSIQTLGTPVAANKTFVWNGSEWAYGNVNEYELQPATDQALGGIKIGYTDSGALRAVQLESGTNKAYVDVTDKNLKNHEIISKTTEVWDQYNSQFYSYQVKCNISNEILKLVDINDFKRETSNYRYTVTLADISFTWSKNENLTNRYIGALCVYGSACKGLFEINIHNSISGNDETYDVGFVVDTPGNLSSSDTETFAWFTNLPWEITARSKASDYTTVVYIKIPDNFAGSVSLKPKYVIAVRTNSDTYPRFHRISSFKNEGTTITECNWESATYPTITTVLGSDLLSSTNGGFTPIEDQRVPQEHITIPNPYNVWVDVFVDTSDADSSVYEATLNVGYKFYDNYINDKVLHNLSYKVRNLEDRIIRLEDLVSRLNTNAQTIEPISQL